MVCTAAARPSSGSKRHRTVRRCTLPQAVHWTSISSCAPTGTARWAAGSSTPAPRLAYRGIVLWRGLIPERDTRAGALGGCDLLRPVYQGGHGVAYYVPGARESTKPGERLLMWGYYLQVPESALASVLVDDQERQQSGSVPFGKVHPEVRAALESRLAGLLPAPLFELVQQSGNSSIQAIYSFVPRSYARNRLCLVGDSGTLVPPFAGSGVVRAVTSAASLADALAGTPGRGRCSPPVE